jgi:hypothetical protein
MVRAGTGQNLEKRASPLVSKLTNLRVQFSRPSGQNCVAEAIMLDQSIRSRHLVVGPLSLLVLVLLSAQVRPEPTRRLITQPIDESKRVELPGNARPEASADNDRGIVPDSLPMEHMQLQLRLPMEKEEELDNLLQKIQDPASPNYHKWLTPEQFKQQFSLAPEDIETITNWLKSQGFTVNVINARSVDFSGTAGQVRSAFRTAIHYFDVRGVRYIANLTNPQIPAALAPAVAGIVSMNDFKPRPINGER